MVLFEVRRHRTVRVETIPDHDHVSAVTAVQETEQLDQLIRVDVLWHQVEVKR
jgi:hypothetical protein